jgi:hypothetical protein
LPQAPSNCELLCAVSPSSPNVRISAIKQVKHLPIALAFIALHVCSFSTVFPNVSCPSNQISILSEMASGHQTNGDITGPCCDRSIFSIPCTSRSHESCSNSTCYSFTVLVTPSRHLRVGCQAGLTVKHLPAPSAVQRKRLHHNILHLGQSTIKIPTVA